MNRVVVVAALVAACSSRAHVQGRVEGHRILCGVNGPAEGDCRTELESYLQRNPDARIAGVDAVYQSGVELVVWTTENRSWPLANDLVVRSATCVKSSVGPNCLSTIDSLWLGPDRSRHQFLVPLISKLGDRLGSWTFLDVQTRDNSLPPAQKVIEVPCRVEKGQSWFADIDGLGVMTARALGSLQSTQTGPMYCEAALTLYLREHSDIYIRSIFAEDVDDGAESLLLLTGTANEGLYPARELSVKNLSCPGTEDCADLFISFRTMSSPRALFGVSVSTRLDNGTPIPALLVVSATK